MSDPETYDEATRALVRQLFAPDEPADPDPDKPEKTGNVVPGEGNNPTGPAQDLHALAEHLFFNPNN